MIEEIEISTLDLNYEGCRMKSDFTEKKLLCSIREIGIREPLLGVNAHGRRILLDGYKRYRCALSLKIGTVPFNSFSDNVACGVIELLRLSNTRSLTMLEQAKLIDHLKSVQKMTTREIADQLEKSKAWVSARDSILKEMSDFVLGQILGGKFPAYSYMYSLKPFIRLNKIKREEIDEFVGLVSGQKLSCRDIEILAHGYFKGCDSFRAQIKQGKLLWGLEQIKANTNKNKNCSEAEQSMLKDLEIMQKYMKRVICKTQDKRLKSSSFYALANLLSESILEQTGEFCATIKEFYDKTRQS